MCTKYQEKIINSSKTAISIMFAGTAKGVMLDPYVAYKAEHLWDRWILGGLVGTRYNRSQSGWFDSVCFKDWFQTVIIPFLRQKDGIKIILGDNLSSHFSFKVLELCEKREIKFICFPAKATLVIQSLDVVFYTPLKHYWRLILNEQKEKERRRLKTLQKDISKLIYKLKNNDIGKNNNNVEFIQ